MQAFSVNEFCREHGISRAHFYKVLRDGRGPKIMKVGDRTLISQESAAEWRAWMVEAAQAEETA